MPLGKALQQHRLLPEVSQASITKRPALALIPNTSWVFFTPPQCAKHVPFFHLTGASSLLDWYQELREELSALKQTVDVWKTTAHDDKGGTSEPQGQVVWDTEMQWLLLHRGRSRIGTR